MRIANSRGRQDLTINHIFIEISLYTVWDGALSILSKKTEFLFQILYLLDFLYTHIFLQKPWMDRESFASAIADLGVSRLAVEATYNLLVTPLDQARNGVLAMIKNSTESNGASLPVAYQPSYLRRFPIIDFYKQGGLFCSPLPALILSRITSGLYYDIVAGPRALLNDSSGRFECYCKSLLSRTMPFFSVSSSQKYKVSGNSVETPDVIIEQDRLVVLVGECKATKLTFAAQFADDPAKAAKKAYAEIAKGVFQIWRYFSHVRRGIVPEKTIAGQAHGMVLTLDTWLTTSRELQEDVIRAAGMLADLDEHITEEDRRAVAFCSIQDLEISLLDLDEASLLKSIEAASGDRFRGWYFPSIYKEIGGADAKVRDRKAYPFDIREILPWWGNLEEMRTTIINKRRQA